MLNHKTRVVRVKVDVDEGVAYHVEHLNEIPFVRTFASCQGTIGEGGPNPYPAQILVYFPESQRAEIEKHFTIGEQVGVYYYVHPKG